MSGAERQGGHEAELVVVGERQHARHELRRVSDAQESRELGDVTWSGSSRDSVPIYGRCGSVCCPSRAPFTMSSGSSFSRTGDAQCVGT